ncbi:MAG: protein kinase [Acidobacteria bacterium]|nr:protein kinase [Acidobacteriota bacterium]
MKTCPTCSKRYEDTNTLCPSDGAVLQKTGDALLGQVLAGKYRIEEKIDEGGMGAVYRATHILMEKTVAIKVLHPALAADDTIVARFTREAKAASRISHPHALTVTDFGESENGVVFLVMEYLRGRTLKDIVRAEGPMPLPRVVEIIRQVCGALTAAHAEGVVHRDLKSDNIMLEESGGGDWAKVLDFGIAKIQEPVGTQDPGLTAPNLIIGTPQYMSPEQCSHASEIDSRSDIYSLGVILYEMLVGHVPFTGDSPTAIMVQHMQDPPPSILEERKDLPAAVGRVVARTLAKNPEERYQSAGELSEDLTLAATGQAPAVVATPTAEHIANTNRIVVPTGLNDAPHTSATAAETDAEEATVVSGKVPPVRRSEQVEEFVPSFIEPPPASNFNPVRIVLPAIAAIAVIFAIVFAFQRTRSNEEQTPPLTSDPNSQPVQSVTPPSGQAETNIVPTSGTPITVPVAGATTSTNVNANVEPSPTPARGAENSNKNTNDNAAPEATPEATPPPSNRNTNRRNLPPPVNSNSNDDDAPPPLPPVKKNPPPPASTPPPTQIGDDSAPPVKPMN